MSEFSKIDVNINNNTRAIACLKDEGAIDKPCFVWLGGFRSDMRGSKAEALSNWCLETGHACLRFDYSGHGESSGEFKEGCISDWLEESLNAVETIEQEEVVLVGSSMGGWISLRVSEEIQKRGLKIKLAGMVLVAPAPDFATELMEPKFTDEQRAQMAANGYFEQMTPYGPDPIIITQKLIDDGANNRVLDKPLTIGCPVAVLQGTEDPDVPWQHAMRLVEHLVADNVTMTMIKGGDHRLSRDEDIAMLLRLCSQII